MGDTGLFLAYLGAFRVCRHLRHELLKVVGEVGLLQRNLLPAAVVEPLLHGRRDVSYRPLFQSLRGRGLAAKSASSRACGAAADISVSRSFLPLCMALLRVLQGSFMRAICFQPRLLSRCSTGAVMSITVRYFSYYPLPMCVMSAEHRFHCGTQTPKCRFPSVISVTIRYQPA